MCISKCVQKFKALTLQTLTSSDIAARRSQRGSSRCPRWPCGSFTQPFGLGETATPAGKRGFIKSFVSLTVLYQMPSDCLVVPSADAHTTGTRIPLIDDPNAQTHAQKRKLNGGFCLYNFTWGQPVCRNPLYNSSYS